MLLGFLALLATPASAYRPLVTEDAGLTDSGKFQLESSVDRSHSEDGGREDLYLFVPAFRAHKHVELSAELPFLAAAAPDEKTVGGIGDIRVMAKVQAREQAGLLPAFTTRLQYKAQNGDPARRLGSGFEEYAAFGVFSWVAGRWQINAHAGPAFPRGNFDATENIQYAGSLDFALRKDEKPLYVLTELYGQASPSYSRVNGPLGWFVGFLYQITPSVALDTGMSWAIAGPEPTRRFVLGATSTFF